MPRFLTTLIALSSIAGTLNTANGQPAEGLAIPLHKRAPVENEIGEVDWARATVSPARSLQLEGQELISRFSDVWRERIASSAMGTKRSRGGYLKHLVQALDDERGNRRIRILSNGILESRIPSRS